MRILIDIGHPAHVHIFKNFAKEIEKNGGKVLFTCRDKEFEKYLLESFGFDYISFGKKFKTIAGKIFGLIKFDTMEVFAALKFKPDLFMGAGSMYAAHAAAAFRKPCFNLEDTFNMEQVKLYLPFTDKIFVSTAGYPDSIDKKKLVPYRGYHELAYLHPNRFTPDISIYKDLGLKEGDKYVLMRFVAWNATHDIGESGFTLDYKINLVKTLAKECAVFISAEEELPKELQQYRLNAPIEKIHHVMAYASLFIGEGATMASECAVLGTPAIYINTLEAYTIAEQEKYGLVFHYKDQEPTLNKALEILQNPNSKEIFAKRRDEMLKEKIDVTQFLLDYVREYFDK